MRRKILKSSKNMNKDREDKLYSNSMSFYFSSFKKKEMEIRFFFILIIFSFCAIIILLRIGYLQILCSEKLVKFHDLLSLRTKKIKHDRGLIFDRNGKKLAINVTAYSIGVNPEIVLKFNDIREQKIWKQLSIELKIPLERIYQKIISSKNLKFIYLVRKVVGLNVRSIVNMKIKGLHVFRELRRYYPYGKISASFLGLTNVNQVGIEGIEKSFNSILNGVDGKKIVRVDKNQKIIEEISIIKKDILPKNITLSVDIDIQSIIYESMNKHVLKNRARVGMSALLDIHTGEILSMVSIPSENPNGYFHGCPTKMTKNRVISDLFEPGSTVKPMIIVKALNEKIINRKSIILTKPYKIGKFLIKDVKKYDFSSISEILQHSSNVGSSKIALVMSSEEILSTYSNFGFGKSTNLNLFNEKNGRFPLSQKKLTPIEKATFSFGYGFMITPLQLVRAYSIIGNYGIFQNLSILKKEDGLFFEKRVFPKKIVQEVIEMMQHVPLEGEKSFQKKIDYQAVIKTGTIKKVNNAKYVHKYISCTVGIAPISHPKYSLIIVIDEPKAGNYYGRLVSTPIFTEIMKKLLNYIKYKDTIKNCHHIL
ncbi:penicillin-binding transpeptidase domain-containing protein [Candidatus Riesia pediculicola]|uniref:penicillin-binding transpeptidase domain-containing protein n=1 Tax=Candidatus Riesia pediculicola TaxID=401619 RepID=UPI0009B7C662|nr:penicillin-binding transpeptidase domain-containing protein [Candidatus Riesia pediculicola]ARC53938.1 hypothetical protein AOE55_02160 [Candidatus Riesia pediculicola]